MNAASFWSHWSLGKGATLVCFACASLIGCGGRDFTADSATSESTPESTAAPERAAAFVISVSGATAAVASAAAASAELPIVVRRQPMGLEVQEGGVAQFSVEAQGPHSLAYQWLRDGEPVAGETGTIFQFSVTSYDDLARISVAMTAGRRTVLSGSALLRVRKP